MYPKGGYTPGWERRDCSWEEVLGTWAEMRDGMEQLWEKGEKMVVLGQRGTVAATSHCLSAGICIPVALRERTACKDWDHPLLPPKLGVTPDSGKVSPK